MTNSFIPLSVPNFAGNERKYVDAAVVSQWVSTGGSLVGEFEEKIAHYAGVPSAVACASGTAGLHLAMLVAGIKAGQEVIAPALTFIAGVNPIKYVNAVPVFLGCDNSLCMDPAALHNFCTKKCTFKDGVLTNKSSKNTVRAIVVVHVFGNLANMEKIMQIAGNFGLLVIEDASEALGSKFLQGQFAGKMAGTIGDVGVYSFNGNKIITTGSGGMLVSRHSAFAKRAKHLSTQAKTDELQFLHDEVGYNYRMTNIQAGLGLAQLEQLEGFIARKKEMYSQYHSALNGKKGLSVLPFILGARLNHWFFSLYLGNDYPLKRDELIDYLQEKNIQTRPVWALINEQGPYAHCQSYSLKKAKDYRARIVNLPCSTNLKDEEIKRVCEEILCEKTNTVHKRGPRANAT